ncbi:glucuronate isomerase [Spirochaeta dissipatitropha]
MDLKKAYGNFMNKDFLLRTETARRLYHEEAAGQPIFDYHCHLNPMEIAQNKQYETITEIWLGGDHYKWRAMRSNGIDESRITGSADPYDKFMAWAETMPKLLGNPLYHWTHLELQRYFDIHVPLNVESAPEIWTECNGMLQSGKMRVQDLIGSSNVHTIGTTDDPSDDLAWHQQIRESGFSTNVIPSYRPDPYINIDSEGFPAALARLSDSSGVKIERFEDVITALRMRVQFFAELGCRASDHALEYVPCKEVPQAELSAIFNKRMEGGMLSSLEADAYKTAVLAELAGEYRKQGWAMQLHIAARRNNNSRFMRSHGPDTGFDSVHDYSLAAGLAGFLDLLDSDGRLPKTILYSLNPGDYYTIGTLMGCFQGDGIPGKIQFGSAWWFNDHRDGMEDQMKILGNLGLLPRFIGMLTDSRSFLSYTRHEYFRRILCNLLGTWAEEGEIPNDRKLLSDTVNGICFQNALAFFS